MFPEVKSKIPNILNRSEITSFLTPTQTGEGLLNMNLSCLPTLLNPLFPKVGLITLAGSSDTGKSALLRQFAIHVASDMDNFLGWPMEKKHQSAIILSSEDDEYAISYLLNFQNRELRFPPEALSSLRFIFETNEPVSRLDNELENRPADVVIIDAFADLYGGEMNASNKVRSFLNEFGNIAKKHECLIIFLHHTGKSTDKLEPSKHNLLGSQGFEAKMRLVMELRRDPLRDDIRHLCIVKGNYLPAEYKNESYVLRFDENMVFHNEYRREAFENLAQGQSTSRKNVKEENLTKTKELKAKGFNQTQIANELNVDKATISRYFKEIENEVADKVAD
jgi:RecA-family ATPase